MSRRAVVTLVIYGAVLATVLVVPTTHDESVGAALFASLLLGHLVLGIGVARWWALAVPLAFAVVLFVVADDEADAAIGLILVWPVAMVLTAVGVAIGRRAGTWIAPVVAVLLAVVAAGPAFAVAEWLRRGPPLPAADEARLPIDNPVALICSRHSDAALDRRLRREVDALVVELGRRPNATVTVTEYYAHYNEDVEMTVRDLGERRLAELEAKGPNCEPALQDRLRGALD